MILIYGGSKKENSIVIEYNASNYQYLNLLSVFEKQLQKYNSSNNDFMRITQEVNLSDFLIPNIVDIYFINIKPHSYFNIYNHIKYQDKNKNLMILYNHNISGDNFTNITDVPDPNIDLMLLIDRKRECNGTLCENYNYYYDITKKISILDIFPIYNNSKLIVNITLIIIKKSFWHL
jgi:hypothetical protein